MAQHFIDSTGVLSNARRTPQGGFLVDATLARVGVMGYSNGTDVLRRYNPSSVLAAHAAEAALAPVTFKHPKKFVDIHNFKDLAKGHVLGTPTFEDGHIKATLAIQDAELIRAIEMGAAREISMGYTAHHDGKPGVTEDGESYDESRIKIEWNHIAVVPAGRAGKTVRLMLDSEDIPDQEQEDEVMEIVINGVKVEGASVQASFDSYDAGLQAQIVELKDEAEKLRVALKTAQDALVVAQSDAALDERLAAKLEAQKVADAAAEKLARVKAKYPTISLENRSQDFIDGLDARIEAEKAVDAEGLGRIENSNDGAKPVEDAKKPKVKKLSARERMIADLKAGVKSENGADAE